MLTLIVWMAVFILAGVIILLAKQKLGTTDKDEGKKEDKRQLSERFKDYWNENYRTVKLPVQVLIWFGVWYIVPEPDNYLWFSFAYLGILYMFASRLIDKVHVFSLILKEGRIRYHILSSKHFQNFDLRDSDGKPTYAKWKLKGKSGSVILADNIDMARKKIIINEICHNVQFVKTIQGTILKIKDRAIRLRNRLAEIVQMREADAMREAYKIYRKNPIISLFSQDDALDEILDPDKYNQSDDDKDDGTDEDGKKRIKRKD